VRSLIPPSKEARPRRWAELEPRDRTGDQKGGAKIGRGGSLILVTPKLGQDVKQPKARVKTMSLQNKLVGGGNSVEGREGAKWGKWVPSLENSDLLLH